MRSSRCGSPAATAQGIYTLHLVNKEAEVDDIDGMLRYNSKCPGVKVRFLQKYLH